MVREPGIADVRLQFAKFPDSGFGANRAAPGMTSGINAIVRGRLPLFAVFGGAYVSGMSGSNACAATPFGRTVDFKFRPICEERELI